MRLDTARAYWRTVSTEIAADAPLYGLIVLYSLAVAAVAGFSLSLVSTTVTVWFVKNWLLLPTLLLILVGLRIGFNSRVRKGLAFRIIFGPQRMGRFFAGIVLLTTAGLFHGMFTTAKLALSRLELGFPNDVLQAEIDRVLHFGVDPLHLLYAVAKNEVVLKLVETVYNDLWFLVVFTVLFLVAISPAARAVRLRYVACYLLTWALVGTVFAALFRSAGPVFYELATGDGQRFADVVNFIAVTADRGTSTLDRVHYLEAVREGGSSSLAGGISAFPSVHVGVTALNAFFAFEVSKRLGYIATGFLAFVLLASVYLGWHYAIDGYAAIAIVAVIYYGMRKAMAVRWKLGAARRVPEGETAA
jgi:hypothetical protein